MFFEKCAGQNPRILLLQPLYVFTTGVESKYKKSAKINFLGARGLMYKEIAPQKAIMKMFDGKPTIPI